MDVPVFLLGPLGRLAPLAIPEVGLSRSPSKVGTVHQAINGNKTQDERAIRRVWEIESAYMEPEDVSLIEAMYVGTIRSPLRLIDPINKNRLSMSTSAAGKLSTWPGATTNWHTGPLGYAYTVYGETPPVSFTNDYGTTTTYGPETCIRWETQEPGTLLAEVDGEETLSTRTVPVFPGEDLVLSGYAKIVSSTGTITMALRFLDATGNIVSDTPADSTDSTDWTRLVTTATVPANAVGAVVVFTSTASGSYDIAQLQLEEGTSPTGWVLGNGCPEVLFTDLGETSPVHPLVGASMRLEER